MNFCAIQVLPRLRVQAIAFRQKVFQRTLMRLKSLRACRTVRTAQLSRPRSMMPLRNVVDFRASSSLNFERSLPVGQPVEHTRSPNGRQVTGIETEKVDPGFALVGYVGADIDLRKRRDPRQ